MDNVSSTVPSDPKITTESFGKFVMAEPFVSNSIEKKTLVAGVVAPAQKMGLVGLKVLANSPALNIVAGSVVYVVGDRISSSWGQKVMELDGVKFILVPEQDILLVRFESLY